MFTCLLAAAEHYLKKLLKKGENYGPSVTALATGTRTARHPLPVGGWKLIPFLEDTVPLLSRAEYYVLKVF